MGTNTEVHIQILYREWETVEYSTLKKCLHQIPSLTAMEEEEAEEV